MKLNQNGKVELYDFQIENYIKMMEGNIELLIKHGDPVINHIVKFLKMDLDRLKEACGIEIKEDSES